MVNMDDESTNSNSKKKTSLTLRSNNNILLGKNIVISGFLNDDGGNVLKNKGILVYIDETYIKTVVTNDNGHFKEFFLAKFPGNREIKCVYEGDWEFERSSSVTNTNVIGENEDEENIADQLEKIAQLYERGLLSDDEFKAAKEKIINN